MTPGRVTESPGMGTMKRLALTAAALVLAQPAAALDFTWRVDGQTIAVDATGDFELASADALARFLATEAPLFHGRRVASISFDSTGGNALGAWNVAQMVHARRLNTSVASSGQCASACVLSWAAGATKSIPYNGAVGVHRCAADTPADADRCTEGSAALLRAASAPASVVDALITTEPEELHWLTAAELSAWGARVTTGSHKRRARQAAP